MQHLVLFLCPTSSRAVFDFSFFSTATVRHITTHPSSAFLSIANTLLMHRIPISAQFYSFTNSTKKIEIKMASGPSRWAPVVVVGEVAAERRPKLDRMMLAKKPGLTEEKIRERRWWGMDVFFRGVWDNKDEVRMSPPRDVDDEDVKLLVDQHVWQSLLDEKEDGEFPWGSVKPPRSEPHKGYAIWFRANAPTFTYPPLEERSQLWVELLGETPYVPQCGPFEVLLPGFVRPMVGKEALHTLLADLPAGLRIATRLVDNEKPKGFLNVAMSLQGPEQMALASRLQAARMKSDLVRCFMILRLWARSLAPGTSKSLEEFFVEAYRRDLVGVASVFPGYYVPAPAAPSGSGFVMEELAEQMSRDLVLGARPVATPAEQHVQPPSAGSSPAGSSSGDKGEQREDAADDGEE